MSDSCKNIVFFVVVVVLEDHNICSPEFFNIDISQFTFTQQRQLSFPYAFNLFYLDKNSIFHHTWKAVSRSYIFANTQLHLFEYH